MLPQIEFEPYNSSSPEIGFDRFSLSKPSMIKSIHQSLIISLHKFMNNPETPPESSNGIDESLQLKDKREWLLTVLTRTDLHYKEDVLKDMGLIKKNLDSFSKEELEEITEALHHIEEKFARLSNTLDEYRAKE